MTRPISARLAVLAGLAMALAATEPAHARAVAGQHGAAPVTDCALRDAPFSAASPLVDILLSPNARAAAERGLGGSLDTLPAPMTGTKAPTFAAILTLKEAAGFLQKSPEDVRRADAALRTIPVTAADRIARCTRYDNARLAFTLPKAGVHLLMFEKINGYRDGPSVDAAHGAFLALAKRKGWSILSITHKSSHP